MLKFTYLKLKDIQSAKKIIFDDRVSLSPFYSPQKKSLTYFTMLKEVYLATKDENKIGVLIVDTSIEEFYFYPNYINAQEISFIEFIKSIDKTFDFSGYTFRFNCNNIKYLSDSKDEYDIISSVKFMTCNLKEFSKNSKYRILDNEELLVRRYLTKKDEEIRVKVQNEIFNNIKGRTQLTLKDVVMEGYSPKFIDDLCFILEKDSEVVGYGQIINLNESYYLVNFGVVSKVRRKGYARNFLTYILLAAYKKGIESIELTVDNLNIPAINLYTSQGFIENRNAIKIKL